MTKALREFPHGPKCPGPRPAEYFVAERADGNFAVALECPLCHEMTPLVLDVNCEPVEQEAAWADVHAATPAGWFVGRPGQRHGGQ